MADDEDEDGTPEPGEVAGDEAEPAAPEGGFGAAAEGDPEGEAVQEAITSPSGTPAYLNFLAHPEQSGKAPPKSDDKSSSESHRVSVSSQRYANVPPFPRGDLGPAGSPEDMGAIEMGRLQGDTDAQKTANDAGAAEKQQFEADNAALLRAQQEHEYAWADVDRRADNAASTEAHKYLAAYAQQEAAVRQMAVDPSGPIGSMSAGQMAGLTLANFAQGFLAARGIHIDVAGQVDKWVDRSIQEQQRRIQQAQAGAEDQLHLMELSRQVSKDEGEARQRYRGWVIAGMQTSIQARAAQFRSDSAMSDASAANAALQTELDKSKFSIWKETHNEVRQDYLAKAQVAHMEGMLSLEKQRLDLQAKAAAAAKAAKTAASPYVALTDPEDPGKVVGWINNKDAAAKKAAFEARDRAQKMSQQLDELADLARKADVYHNAPDSQRAREALDENFRAFQRQRANLVLTIGTGQDGKRLPAAMYEKYEKLLPTETEWQKGNNSRAISEVKHRIAQDFEAARNTYAVKPAEDPEAGRATSVPTMARERAEWKAVNSPEGPVSDAVTGERRAAEPPGQREIPNETIASSLGLGARVEQMKHDNAAAMKPLDTATPGWKSLVGNEPQSPETPHVESLVLTALDPAAARKRHSSSGTLSEQVHHVDSRGVTHVNAPLKTEIPESDGDLSNQAMDALTRMAEEGTASGKYAARWLETIKRDPAEAKRLVRKSVDVDPWE